MRLWSGKYKKAASYKLQAFEINNRPNIKTKLPKINRKGLP